MSECVVRMEMPGCCLECPFFNKVGCKASGKMFPDWMNVAARPKDCPILAVLPEKHGRLVDADALYKKRYIVEPCDILAPITVVDACYISGAQTIVPATEGGDHDHR